MQKLAAASEVGEELLKEEGVDINDLTPEQASEVLIHVLNNFDFSGEEKTAAVVVEEMSQDEEGLQKLAAAGEVAHEHLKEEGVALDDLSEEQAAELLLNIIAGSEEHEEKTAAVQEDLEKIASLRQAGAIIYSGFRDAMLEDE
jgi:S-adenosylhomocysteine hydrolase